MGKWKNERQSFALIWGIVWKIVDALDRADIFFNAFKPLFDILQPILNYIEFCINVVFSITPFFFSHDQRWLVNPIFPFFDETLDFLIFLDFARFSGKTAVFINDES